MRTRYLPDGWTPIAFHKKDTAYQVIGRNAEGLDYTFIFNRNLDFATMILSSFHINHNWFEDK